ncbi:hypothetical protein CHS0354_031411, partial [Potamilus streckersoni]
VTERHKEGKGHIKTFLARMLRPLSAIGPHSAKMSRPLKKTFCKKVKFLEYKYRNGNSLFRRIQETKTENFIVVNDCIASHFDTEKIYMRYGHDELEIFNFTQRSKSQQKQQ